VVGKPEFGRSQVRQDARLHRDGVQELSWAMFAANSGVLGRGVHEASVSGSVWHEKSMTLR
jgi:hypothetical protein